jgi:sodium pump decarboxylase gamma subunit
MNIDQLLLQSLQLLGLGMGSVFIILSLLIVIINVIAKLVPEVEIVPATSPSPVTSSTNMQHIAAIQAAVHKYRRSRQSNS